MHLPDLMLLFVRVTSGGFYCPVIPVSLEQKKEGLVMWGEDAGVERGVVLLKQTPGYHAWKFWFNTAGLKHRNNLGMWIFNKHFSLF